MFVKLGILAIVFTTPLCGNTSAKQSHLLTISEDTRARCVAAALYYGAAEKDAEYLGQMVRGMHAAESGERQLSMAEIYDALMRFEEARLNHKAASNLQRAVGHFENLSQDQQYTEVIENELYYRTLVPGDGPGIESTTQHVQLNYIIKSISSSDAITICDNFASDSPPSLKASELIVGLRQGLLGMKSGERREIHIHPKWAYGSQSSFEPNLALMVTVELLSFGGIDTGPHPSTSLPTAALVTDQEYESRRQDAAFAEGYMAWSHYKQLTALVSLEAVATQLLEIADSGVSITSSDRLVYALLQSELLPT